MWLSISTLKYKFLEVNPFGVISNPETKYFIFHRPGTYRFRQRFQGNIECVISSHRDLDVPVSEECEGLLRVKSLRGRRHAEESPCLPDSRHHLFDPRHLPFTRRPRIQIIHFNLERGGECGNQYGLSTLCHLKFVCGRSTLFCRL